MVFGVSRLFQIAVEIVGLHHTQGGESEHYGWRLLHCSCALICDAVSDLHQTLECCRGPRIAAHAMRHLGVSMQ
jgi:hypothetical protein